jgi:enediyne biosynthesis protein E4
VDNPFDIVKGGHNLSAYERKRVFLNVRGPDGGRNFVDVSGVSGADNDGDGRCVVAADFRHTGQLDVVLRQSGGGPLVLYENHFPMRHYLEVSLRGTMKEYEPGRRSNRLGIGARLVAVVNGQQIVREMYPLNSFRSQMPNVVHFGLGDADRVEKLTILWPSGLKQVLTDLKGDRHIVVEEGADAVEDVRPGRTVPPLSPLWPKLAEPR